MAHRTSSGKPRWFSIAFDLLVAVALFRASLLQYLLEPASIWNLARIGFAYALFTMFAQFAMTIGDARGRMVRSAWSLAIPVVLVSIVRVENGSSASAVVECAVTALVGGVAGIAIGAVLRRSNRTADK
jgi:hypothetical protein